VLAPAARDSTYVVSGAGSDSFARGRRRRTVLDDEAERPHALVEPHVRVQEARLLHGEVVADGEVAPQPRCGVLQLQDRHASTVHRLNLRELARCLERLERHREVTDERLLLDVRGRAWAGDEREVEIGTWLGPG